MIILAGCILAVLLMAFALYLLDDAIGVDEDDEGLM